MIKSKIAVAITLFVFFVLTTAILTAGLITQSNEKKVKAENDSQQLLGASNENNTGGQTTSTVLLTTEFVSGHNKTSDCWIMIADHVYDVTTFLSSHPGGSEMIIPYCGKDASKAFASKDKNPSVRHSSLADGMLKDYLVGKLGDSINVTNLVATDPTGSATKAKAPAGKTQPIFIPTGIPQSPPVNPGVALTGTEVAKHSTQVDCWMIISGNVYNLTSYVTNHPGGLIIVQSCGRDGTGAFQTQGGKGSHSGYAHSLLTSYLVGPLNSTSNQLSGNTGSTSPTTINPTPLPNQTINTSGSLPASILIKYPNAEYVSGKYEDNSEWEGKINVSGGCRVIKTNSSGSIVEDQNC